MPVFGVEEYLEKCVDSVLAQTFRDFELIIVDDGSPDACGIIADEYAEKDPRVRVIHKENGGAPSARNAGMKEASGAFFYFPDSDDWLEKDYLKRLYETAVRTDAEMVMSGFKMEYYEGGRSSSYTVSVPDMDYKGKEAVRNHMHRYLNNMMLAVPWNKLYRASNLREKDIRFPDLKWDDLHFNMEVIRDADHVAVCSTSGYHFFRSRPGSETTRVFDGELYKRRREQFRHIVSVYRDWDIRDREIASQVYGYYAARLVQCVSELSVSNCGNRKEQIKDILSDPVNRKALRIGKIDAGLLNAAAAPMRRNSVTGSFVMGRAVGFVKRRMANRYYYLKSSAVNQARQGD